MNRQELEEFWKVLEDENQYLNELGAGNPRIPRKTSKPKKSKKLTGLIEKALKLVRRVEEIGERKRTIETLNKPEPIIADKALEDIKNLKVTYNIYTIQVKYNNFSNALKGMYAQFQVNSHL